MNARVQEILDILQEECAEVIVEVSKCRRFGIDSLHYVTQIPHKEMLQQEIGDVLAMIKLLVDEGIISADGIESAAEKKIQKLHKWSNIFEQAK